MPPLLKESFLHAHSLPPDFALYLIAKSCGSDKIVAATILMSLFVGLSLTFSPLQNAFIKSEILLLFLFTFSSSTSTSSSVKVDLAPMT